MGFMDKEYNKVNFFKRFVFIQSIESKEIRIPDHIFVSYEGMSFKIFLEIENKCKLCQEAHSNLKLPTRAPTEKVDLNARLDQVRTTHMQVDVEEIQPSTPSAPAPTPTPGNDPPPTQEVNNHPVLPIETDPTQHASFSQIPSDAQGDSTAPPRTSLWRESRESVQDQNEFER